MVGIKLSGRLGNQMFQFAFIFCTSKKLNVSFFIIDGDSEATRFYLPRYFVLDGFNPLLNSAQKVYFSFKKGKTTQFDSAMPPSTNLAQTFDNLVYQGYMQSEEYTLGMKKELKKMFKFKDEFLNDFKEGFGSLFANNKTIAIHIRRKDYTSFGDEELGGKDLTLPLSYYENCLKKIDNVDGYKVVFVSDDIQYVKKKMFPPQNNYYYADHDNMAIDFQIIQNADIAIVSNSTFAWWGAYLNNKVNCTVYAPKYWLGFKVKHEHPKGITSVKEWNWISG